MAARLGVELEEPFVGGGNTIARHGEGAADGGVVLPLDVVQVVLDDLE